ncbi:MAG: VOC family protein [Ignavibacteria bacterium]
MKKKSVNKIVFEKIDIATGRLDEMVKFYNGLFGIEFEEIVFEMDKENWKRYLGNLGGIKFHLVPNETSNTEKDQEGVHQFHIHIKDFDKFKNSAVENGFELKECDFGEGKIQYLIRDPDGHPWIIN